jgi:hypothetical protein
MPRYTVHLSQITTQTMEVDAPTPLQAAQLARQAPELVGEWEPTQVLNMQGTEIWRRPDDLAALRDQVARLRQRSLTSTVPPPPTVIEGPPEVLVPVGDGAPADRTGPARRLRRPLDG